MDYLVRCKEWVSGLVPAMTSDTTPEGQCFTDGIAGDNYRAYKAFNRGDSYWAINNASVGHYIGYIFTEPKIVNSVGMFTGTGTTTSSGYVSSFRVEGSNDGSSWTALSSTLSITPATGYTIFYIYNNTSYTRYRIYTLSSQSYTYINTIQFYSSVLCSERAMYFIGQNNYASDTLLADTDWLDAICDSQYMEYILNTKVPVMTSNTTPYGEAFASSTYSANGEFKTFDNDVNTLYYSASNQSYTTWYLGYKFLNPVKIYKVTTTAIYEKSYSINVCAGTSKESLSQQADPQTGSAGRGVKVNKTYIFSPSQEMEYWGLKCTASEVPYMHVAGSYAFMIYDAQFYGRTDIPDPSPEPSGYKALVPIMTSNTTPSGTVTCSSAYSSGYDGWKAFDGTTGWWETTAVSSGGMQHYVQYKFDSYAMATSIDITLKYTSGFDSGCYIKVEASKDGTNFYNIVPQTFYSTIPTTKLTFNIEHPDYYKYYRLYELQYNQNVKLYTGHIVEAQLYGYEYQYGTALIPTMSSDTTPVGECISSGVYLTYPNYYAFDESTTTFWHSPEGSEADLPWVGYHFTSPVKVKHIYFMNRSSGAAGAVHLPKTPILQGSNDGNAWYTVQQLTMTNFDIGGVNEFDIIDNNEYYTYYRLLGSITSANQYYFCCTKLQLYGFRQNQE